MKSVTAWLIVNALLYGTAWSQITPLASPQRMLTRINVQSAKVPGNGTVANITVPVTNTPTADDLLDIRTSSPSTQVSIVLPNGTQITPTDGASTNGLVFNVYAIPDDSSSDDLSPFTLPGNQGRNCRRLCPRSNASFLHNPTWCERDILSERRWSKQFCGYCGWLHGCWPRRRDCWIQFGVHHWVRFVDPYHQ